MEAFLKVLMEDENPHRLASELVQRLSASSFEVDGGWNSVDHKQYKQQHQQQRQTHHVSTTAQRKALLNRLHRLCRCLEAEENEEEVLLLDHMCSGIPSLLQQPCTATSESSSTTAQHHRAAHSTCHLHSKTTPGTSHHSTSCCFLMVETIRQVAISGFLTGPEVGRLFLWTNQQLFDHVGRPFGWNLIRQSLFPDLHPNRKQRSHQPKWLPSSGRERASLSRIHQEADETSKNHHWIQQASNRWIVQQLSKTSTPPSLHDISPTDTAQSTTTRRRSASTTTTAPSTSTTNDDLSLQSSIASVPTPPSPSYWPSLPKPTMETDELSLVLQWYDNRRSTPSPPMATLLVPNLKPLLDTGRLEIDTLETNSEMIDFDPQNCDQVHVTVHCIRRRQGLVSSEESKMDRGDMNMDDGDLDCCCLHETGEHSWDPNHEPRVVPRTNNFDRRTTNSTNGRLILGPKQPVCLQTSGLDLEARLARGDKAPGGFELLILAQSSTIPDSKVSSKTHGSTKEGSRCRVDSICLELWANYNDQLCVFDSRQQTQKHGVSLLHILEQFRGWDRTSSNRNA